MMKSETAKIEEFNPVDGQFFLITKNGKLLGKAWDLESARIIATAFDKAVVEQSRGEPIAVRCKDCKYYREADDGAMCFNIDSDWRADYPSEYGSCEHGRRK